MKVSPRALATVLGTASAGFGLVPLVAPRRAARLFGVPVTADPASELLLRGVGARELVVAAGLLAGARRGTGTGTWGLARAASDAGDLTGALLAMRAGSSDRKLVGSAVSATVGVLGGLSLWWSDRPAVDAKEGAPGSAPHRPTPPMTRPGRRRHPSPVLPPSTAGLLP